MEVLFPCDLGPVVRVYRGFEEVWSYFTESVQVFLHIRPHPQMGTIPWGGTRNSQPGRIQKVHIWIYRDFLNPNPLDPKS